MKSRFSVPILIVSAFIPIFWIFGESGQTGIAGSGSSSGESTTGVEESRSLLVFIAQGEVVAVQRDRGALRLSSLDSPQLARKSASQLREYFLTGPGKQLMLLDRQGKESGFFDCNRIEVETGLRPGSIRSITIFGYFKLNEESELSFLSLGYRAGLYSLLQGIPPGERYSPPPRSPPRQIRHAVDGKLMMFIPEDFLAFGQGENPRLDNYNPHFYDRHPKITPMIRAFYMDRYEVTNREYFVFCQRSGHPLPGSWEAAGTYPAGEEDHPVIVATFNDAEAYARWAGKRLPTELEWELAARGGLNLLFDMSGPRSIARDPRTYSTGSDFDKDKCNTLESGHGRTLSVLSLRDESPFGIFGMCGNAPEWTSSWYNLYPGHNLLNVSSAAGRQFRVIRGGSFFENADAARTDSRNYGGFPTPGEDRSAGFRLVTDA